MLLCPQPGMVQRKRSGTCEVEGCTRLAAPATEDSDAGGGVASGMSSGEESGGNRERRGKRRRCRQHSLAEAPGVSAASWWSLRQSSPRWPGDPFRGDPDSGPVLCLAGFGANSVGMFSALIHCFHPPPPSPELLLLGLP